MWLSAGQNDIQTVGQYYETKVEVKETVTHSTLISLSSLSETIRRQWGRGGGNHFVIEDTPFTERPLFAVLEIYN